MTILVLGAGALGRTFAACLGAAGESVTLAVTTRAAKELSSAGHLRILGARECVVPTRLGRGGDGSVGLLPTAEIEAVDGIIFATKAHQLDDAARSASHVATGWVLGLQNGVGKDDILQSAFGVASVLRCVTMVAAERDAHGDVTTSNLGTTYVGEIEGSNSDRAIGVAAMLQAAGLPAEAREDLEQIEWSKAANVAGTFGVDLLAGARWSDAMESEHLTRVFVGLAQEVAAIAAAEGILVGDFPGLPAQTYAAQPVEASIEMRRDRLRQMRASGASLERRSSLQQDLDLGRHTEADVIFSDLVEYAARHDLKVPRLELIRDIARAHVPAAASDGLGH